MLALEGKHADAKFTAADDWATLTEVIAPPRDTRSTKAISRTSPAADGPMPCFPSFMSEDALVKPLALS